MGHRTVTVPVLRADRRPGASTFGPGRAGAARSLRLAGSATADDTKGSAVAGHQVATERRGIGAGSQGRKARSSPCAARSCNGCRRRSSRTHDCAILSDGCRTRGFSEARTRCTNSHVATTLVQVQRLSRSTSVGATVCGGVTLGPQACSAEPMGGGPSSIGTLRQPRQSPVGDVLICAVVLLAMIVFWCAFRVRTKCGVIKQKGGTCGNGTRGILMGCKQYHYWDKFFAWSRFLGLAPAVTRAGVTVPRLGSASSSNVAVMHSGTPAAAPTKSDRREVLTFYCTIISTIGTIVGTVVAIIALP
jgi:hypothetical protein